MPFVLPHGDHALLRVLIDPNDPLDPIRMQAVPSGKELEDCPDDLSDPLNETGDSPRSPHRP